jgi:glycosyltransferase involved in cell wall biosynthesis
LDIYGQVDSEQTEWFEKLCNSFPDEIQYCGLVPYDKSVDVIKEYFALLFPTKFYTEGIPGTVIDAYAAGVPVIASRWESFEDSIEQGITGIGYTFGKKEELKIILMKLIEEPNVIYDMKRNCLAKAIQYLPQKGMDIFLSNLSL